MVYDTSGRPQVTFREETLATQGPVSRARRAQHIADVEDGLASEKERVAARASSRDHTLRSAGVPADEDNDDKHGPKKGVGLGADGIASQISCPNVGDLFLDNAYLFLALCAIFVVAAAYLTLHGVVLSLPPSATEGYAVVDSHTCGSDEEKIYNVWKWARGFGVYINPNITTGTFPIPGTDKTVRGLMANGSIRNEQVLFAVPPQAMLNIRLMDTHPRLAQVWKEVPEMHKGLAGLAVLLLHEALNASSEWRPYLCSLPRHVPLPIFYSPKKLVRERAKMVPAEQHAKFDEVIESTRDLLEVHYVETMPKLFTKYPEIFSPADYTYARWAWACSIITSRTWGKKVEDAVLKNLTGQNFSNVHTLVPAADMPNHGVGTFTARFTSV